MSEIMFKSLVAENPAAENMEEEEEYVSLCCGDCSDLIFTVKKQQLKQHSNYFRDILDRMPLCDNKEVILFLKDVPSNDLKVIVEYINGEEIQMTSTDLSSLETSCETLKIDKLLTLVKDERNKIQEELKTSDLLSEVSDTSSPEQRVVSEFITTDDGATQKCVFEKLWFKEGCDELNNESDELEFSLSTVNSDGKTCEQSSSASSSVYFDCSEPGEHRKAKDSEKRKRQDSEIVVEDAVIEVETSSNSSNSIDSSLAEYTSVTTVKVPTNEAENPLNNSFSSICTQGSASSCFESCKDTFEPPFQQFGMPGYIYLPPFSSIRPPGFRYNTCYASSVAVPPPPPPPLTPFYSVIRSGRDEIQKPASDGSSSAATDGNEVKPKKKKRTVPRFRCGICGREMGWRQSVRVHIFQQHPGNDPSQFIEKLDPQG